MNSYSENDLSFRNDALLLTKANLHDLLAIKGKTIARRKKYTVWTFGLVALVLAYAQDIPLSLIQNIVQSSWYQSDVVEKFLSFAFLWLGIREASGVSKCKLGIYVSTQTLR